MGPGAYTYHSDSGSVWYLHARNVTLKNGLDVRIYYFCKDQRDNTVEELPQGYFVVESQRTGLPLLKKTR